MSKARVKALKDACSYAVNRWPANGEVTYCNIATHHVAVAMGFTGFRGMIANDMVALMKKSPDFAKVNAESAQKLANDGKLVIAGIQDEPHGHVAVCHPGELVYSKNLRGDVPTVSNVGRTNGVMGLNWCFTTMPGLYAYIEAV